jgi:hypothetical protein
VSRMNIWDTSPTPSGIKRKWYVCIYVSLQHLLWASFLINIFTCTVNRYLYAFIFHSTFIVLTLHSLLSPFPHYVNTIKTIDDCLICWSIYTYQSVWFWHYVLYCYSNQSSVTRPFDWLHFIILVSFSIYSIQHNQRQWQCK